jgi:hypothetical protein
MTGDSLIAAPPNRKRVQARKFNRTVTGIFPRHGLPYALRLHFAYPPMLTKKGTLPFFGACMVLELSDYSQ